KYSLGLYTTLDEAKGLQKELIKIGFNDAFVASYINGKRQKIHN
ncbi:sporulation protein, partial [Rhodobacteraceae bacterium 4F10]